MPQASYHLGVDLGTTYSAAAVYRHGETAPHPLALGEQSTAVASMVFLAPDGSMLCGDAAQRRAVTEPRRVVREFKRRIGDTTPLVVGGTPVAAEDVAARFVAWILQRVAEREGGPPECLALTHPAEWGLHKRDSVKAALARHGVTDVVLLSEPEAAAIGYASTERIEVGGTVAVYDLGGGTFDAAVVRKLPDGGFELAGKPVGIERLGGVDFDEAVFDHVRSAIGDAWQRLDPMDPAVQSAVANLRRECTAAKEALSVDTEVLIPVMLPGGHTQVRLCRGEFEEQIRPAVADTVEALRRALDAAGVSAADLDAVLMVGGSSRIPLITQMVSTELGRPVAVDADPKSVIATGAAIASRGGAAASTPAPTPQPRKAAGPDPSRAGPCATAATHAAGPADGADPAPAGHGFGPPRPALTTTPRAAAALDGARVDAERRPEPRRTGRVIAGLGLAASVVSGVAILAFSGNDADAAPPRTATVLAAGPITSPDRAPVTGTAPVDEWTGTAPTDTTLAGPRQPVYLAAAARPRVRTTPTGAAGASPAAPPASTSSSTTSPDAPPAPAGSSDDPGPGGNTPGGTGGGTELGEGDDSDSGDTTGGNSDTEPGSGGGSGTGDPGAGNGDPGSGTGDPGGSADPDGSDPDGSDPGAGTGSGPGGSDGDAGSGSGGDPGSGTDPGAGDDGAVGGGTGGDAGTSADAAGTGPAAAADGSPGPAGAAAGSAPGLSP